MPFLLIVYAIAMLLMHALMLLPLPFRDAIAFDASGHAAILIRAFRQRAMPFQRRCYCRLLCRC